MNSTPMLLKLILPDSEERDYHCDSVHLPVADDSKGRGGGQYGIRCGHAKAVIALGNGRLTALNKGESIFSVNVSGGFARVEDNIISLVTEKVSE